MTEMAVGALLSAVERTPGAWRRFLDGVRLEEAAIKLKWENAPDGRSIYPAEVSQHRQAQDLEKRCAMLEGLLREWRQTPFFEDPGDWEAWVRSFRPRVDEVLGEDR